MKARFTIGNIFGGILYLAGVISANTDLVSAIIPPKISVPLLSAAGAILYFAKGGTTSNAAQIPTDKKSEGAGVVFEKTGPLK